MRDLIFKHGDAFDTLITAQNKLFGFSDINFDWPNTDLAQPNDGVDPELFYNVANGTPDYSEINAIQFYRNMAEKYDNVATAYSGVSIVEMQHWDKVKDFINKIGGDVYIVKYDNSGLISITERAIDPISAIKESIRSEKDTINEYEYIKSKIENESMTVTQQIAVLLLNKLIADETYHINEIFKPILANLYNQQ